MFNVIFNWNNILSDWGFSRWIFISFPMLIIVLLPIWKESKSLFFYLLWSFYIAIFVSLGDNSLSLLVRFRARPEIWFWTMFLFLGVLVLFNCRKFLKLELFISFLFYLNIALILFDLKGFYNNVSLSGTLLTVLYTFRFKNFFRMSNVITEELFHKRILFTVDTILVFICFFILQSSMGILAFLIGVYIAFFIFFKFKGRLILTFILFFVCLTVHLYMGKYFYTFSGRIELWENVINLMTKLSLKRQLIGFGYGSYSGLGIFLQAKNGVLLKGITYFLQLHNDVLQTFFESGWIGLILWFWLMLESFYKSIKNKQYWLIYFCVAWGVSSLGNYPGHLAIEFFLFFIVMNYIHFKPRISQW